MTIDDTQRIPRDANGREFKVGDLVRTPHFRGPRRKQFYLYHVITRRDDYLWAVPVCVAAGIKPKGGTFLITQASAATLARAEIIDGYGDGDGCDFWYDRPRVNNSTGSLETSK